MVTIERAKSGFLFILGAFILTGCVNPMARPPDPNSSVQRALRGETKITEPTESQRNSQRDRQNALADQAKKLGDTARAQRIVSRNEASFQWTEARLAKRNEVDFGYAEQDASPSSAADINTVAKFMSDRTKTSWSPQYGLQVSYSAPDGTNYLWYPGNNVILKAQWKVEAANQLTGGFVFLKMDDQLVKHTIDAAQICYLYGANTVDAVSRRPGGRWQCQGWNYFKSVAREHRQGDIFGLSKSSQVPFILARDEDKIVNLQRRLPKVQAAR